LLGGSIYAESSTFDKKAQEDEVRAWQSVIAALQPLDEEARQRIVESVTTFLRIAATRPAPLAIRDSDLGYRPQSYPAFSTDTAMSPKEFMLDKQPLTDVERVACLAYYLTHYRSVPNFKTLDLSKLNTEAAQPKFSNAANSVNNAVKRGYLVPANKGFRQLSAAGEQFVRALPDRAAAKQAMEAARPRRRSKRVRIRKPTTAST
jgi:hypothetical protein